MTRQIIAAIAVCLLAPPATAHEFSTGNLHVGHPWSPPGIGMARTLAGYMTIRNDGDVPDRLVEVRADFPRVMLHETVMQGDVATMPGVDGVVIAPGETVTFAPGGRHVMFMGPGGVTFAVGQKIDAVLVFETAGELPVTFSVDDPAQHAAGAATDQHSGHDLQTDGAPTD